MEQERGLSSRELWQGRADGEDKIVAILPKRKAENQNQGRITSWDLIEKVTRRLLVQWCRYPGLLAFHSLWPKVKWFQRIKAVRGLGGVGGYLEQWDWTFCAFFQKLQRAGEQNQVCSPYQTFSFLLFIPPSNRDCHLLARFVRRCHCRAILGALILNLIWSSPPAWTFVIDSLGEKLYVSCKYYDNLAGILYND